MLATSTLPLKFHFTLYNLVWLTWSASTATGTLIKIMEDFCKTCYFMNIRLARDKQRERRHYRNGISYHGIYKCLKWYMQCILHRQHSINLIFCLIMRARRNIYEWWWAEFVVFPTISIHKYICENLAPLHTIRTAQIRSYTWLQCILLFFAFYISCRYASYRNVIPVDCSPWNMWAVVHWMAAVRLAVYSKRLNYSRL